MNYNQTKVYRNVCVCWWFAACELHHASDVLYRLFYRMKSFINAPNKRTHAIFSFFDLTLVCGYVYVCVFAVGPFGFEYDSAPAVVATATRHIW